MFTQNDLQQIQKQGSNLALIEQQIQDFRQGFPFLPILKAATVGDGILQNPDNAFFIQKFEQALSQKSIIKFVPASGAASRMFKNLFSFKESYKNTDAEYQAYLSNKKADSPQVFFENIKQFAFFEDLERSYGKSLEEGIKNRDFVGILEAFLGENGLNYGNLPKGLLKFHAYLQGNRTPAEEHLVEGAVYANQNGKVGLHFTVSPEHQAKFEALISQVLDKYEQEHQVRYTIDFSIQKPATDTIAVDLENNPFRQDDGTLLFRPAGHGALLANLDEIDADIIFIKNIDNVVPDRLKETTFEYKKVLGGILVVFQEKIAVYLEKLENPTDALLDELDIFLKKELCILPVSGFENWEKDAKIAYFKQKLHRPIKVCGMVKNEGEAGGGPFWAKNQDGTVSLQIVESAQVDMQDEEQKNIAQNATHFNPVDLVCGVKDHKGKKFDLLAYRDAKTGFVTQKSQSGRDLKAQELPGLWNGAMSDWNTIFVQVPILTFNPVKVVNDLLREQHQ